MRRIGRLLARGLSAVLSGRYEGRRDRLRPEAQRDAMGYGFRSGI